MADSSKIRGDLSKLFAYRAEWLKEKLFDLFTEPSYFPELDSDVPVVLMGGRGTVIGTFIGVLIIAVLDSGLAQMGMSEPAKRIITGAVIVLAVLLDKWRAKA